ncbi:MAG: flagellar basal body-associated FliL family protein [Piscinibacter sp.]|nr:flagellar basal body-associated FliL family protein [Piscinibacter sp.]
MADTLPPAADDRPPVSLDARRLWLIGAGLAAVLLVPLGAAVGLSWVEMPWAENDGRTPPPEWVALPQLRATTSDGVVVRARVALDVPGTLLKNTIQRNTQQVGLLLELSVASRTRAELGSPDGMSTLSQDMRTRLNAYLGVEDGEPGVQSVAIQDLLVKPQ